MDSIPQNLDEAKHPHDGPVDAADQPTRRHLAPRKVKFLRGWISLAIFMVVIGALWGWMGYLHPLTEIQKNPANALYVEGELRAEEAESGQVRLTLTPPQGKKIKFDCRALKYLCDRTIIRSHSGFTESIYARLELIRVGSRNYWPVLIESNGKTLLEREHSASMFEQFRCLQNVSFLWCFSIAAIFAALFFIVGNKSD